MKTMKLLAIRSACMLAVAGLLAGGAIAQAPQAARTTHPGQQTRPQHAVKPDKRVAANKAKKHGHKVATSKKKPKAIAGSGGKAAKSAVAKKKPSTQPAVAAKTPPRSQAVARRAPAPLPPPVAWVPPPLGPERFYPNGIPELRPEFLHPLTPPPRVDPPVSEGPRMPAELMVQ